MLHVADKPCCYRLLVCLRGTRAHFSQDLDRQLLHALPKVGLYLRGRGMQRPQRPISMAGPNE